MVQKKKLPLRRCIGCGEMKEKGDLIRIMKDEENRIAIDPGGRRNGRGAYLCRDASCLQKAIKSRALERSLKCRVESAVYESLAEQLQNQDPG